MKHAAFLFISAPNNKIYSGDFRNGKTGNKLLSGFIISTNANNGGYFYWPVKL